LASRSSWADAPCSKTRAPRAHSRQAAALLLEEGTADGADGERGRAASDGGGSDGGGSERGGGDETVSPMTGR
jgi:hypothetical protein